MFSFEPELYNQKQESLQKMQIRAISVGPHLDLNLNLNLVLKLLICYAISLKVEITSADFIFSSISCYITMILTQYNGENEERCKTSLVLKSVDPLI
jgi:hypothetical protein